MTTVEIERKFLVSSLPNLPAGDAIKQGYISADGVRVVRIRQKSTQYFLTIKDGAGLQRGEVEVELNSSQFETLWPLTQTRRLEKTRYRIPITAGLVAEIDLFDGPLAGLSVVEVEFQTVAAAEDFKPPEWFGREVTDETGWSNLALAEYGVPAPQ